MAPHFEFVQNQGSQEDQGQHLPSHLPPAVATPHHSGMDQKPRSHPVSRNPVNIVVGPDTFLAGTGQDFMSSQGQNPDQPPSHAFQPAGKNGYAIVCMLVC